MATWRDTQAVMDRSTLAAFGEQVTIDGVCVLGNVLEDAFESTGLGLPVEGQRVTVLISSEDKKRLQIAKGMRVDYRGKSASVADVQITNTTIWRVDLE